MSKLDFTVKRPAVLLTGGPRSGWAYYADDLAAQVRSFELDGLRFPYKPAGYSAEHPHSVPKVRSEVWEYVPEWDAFAPKPPPPPSKLEVVAAAVAMCGQRGGQLSHIVNNLPERWGAAQIAPLVFWLTRQGVIEASPQVMDPYYRTVRTRAD